MKSCLEEYQDFNVDEIAEKYIEGEPQITKIAVNPDEGADCSGEQIRGDKTEDSTINEGTITYDIRFGAMVPDGKESIKLIINVESQNDFYPGYPLIKRGIYYASRMISSQYGVEFTDSHYEKIHKVCSIWICANPPEYRKNTISKYTIKEENSIGEVREKKKILQDDFEIKMTKTLESEVREVCNLSKGVEERGIEKGILKSIENLMETLKLSAEQAMTALKVPEEDKPKYASKLNQ